jgi:hypothetical protein
MTGEALTLKPSTHSARGRGMGFSSAFHQYKDLAGSYIIFFERFEGGFRINRDLRVRLLCTTAIAVSLSATLTNSRPRRARHRLGGVSE